MPSAVAEGIYSIIEEIPSTRKEAFDTGAHCGTVMDDVAGIDDLISFNDLLKTLTNGLSTDFRTASVFGQQITTGFLPWLFTADHKLKY